MCIICRNMDFNPASRVPRPWPVRVVARPFGDGEAVPPRWEEALAALAPEAQSLSARAANGLSPIAH